MIDSNVLMKLLAELENELRFLSLWSENSPPQAALTSQQPFCCDTLKFEQWLQFVFLPKIGLLVDLKANLPTSISLCPMAEEAFKFQGNKAANLINCIGDIDELLSGQRHQTLFLN